MLTDRQRRFAECYAETGNASEAARKAGYSGKTAYSTGSRLLRNAEVFALIRQLQDEAAEIRILTVKEVRASLSDIVRDTTKKDADRISAANALLRSAGSFVHVRHDEDDPGGWTISKSSPVDDVIVYLPALESEADALIPFEFDE